MPSLEQFEKRAGKVMEDFKALVFPPGYVAGAKKRPVRLTFVSVNVATL